MSKMTEWEFIAEGSDRKSFKNLFELQFTPPEDRSLSERTKYLSIDEKFGSGPSLRSLEELRVDQLTLGEGFGHSWAMESLSAYGPKGFEDSWGELAILMDIQEPNICCEAHVGNYLDKVFFKRAMCGGFFLYSLMKGLRPDFCPGMRGGGFNFVDESTMGPSGRPDRQFTYKGNKCCLVEMKTKRVCTCNGRDILDNPNSSSIFPSGKYTDEWFNGLTADSKKITQIIYQVCWFSREIFVSLIILKSPDMASAYQSILRSYHCFP
jgi:hypothetical protein